MSPSAVDRTDWYQGVFLGIFRLLASIDRFRGKHRVTWHAASSVISLTVTVSASVALGVEAIRDPSWWPLGPLSAATVSKGLISISGGLVVKFFVFEGLFPLLAYLPKTIANRALGFHAVALDENASVRLTAEQVAARDPASKVKVLCISGRYLFQEKTTPAGQPTPLRDLARMGDLEVIMPSSTATNPTVAERYRTYTDAMKKHVRDGEEEGLGPRGQSRGAARVACCGRRGWGSGGAVEPRGERRGTVLKAALA